MSNKVGHEGAQPNQPSSLTSTEDLNQHRRQREELDLNQTYQRRRIDDTSATEDNTNSSSLSISQENVERLREQFYLQWDRQMEDDAIHDSDNDDDDDDDDDNDDDDDDDETEEESSVFNQGWNSKRQDDQNQEWTYRSLAAEVDHDILLAAEVVHDIEFQITNEDESVTSQRYDSGMLISLNNNIGMSYEELTELDERISMVQRSSKDTISKQLKTRVHATSADSTEGKIEICTVCQDGYENKDKIATLDCKHEYHEDCITQWLVRKNVCPICKRQALMTEESKGDEVNEC